MWLLYHIAWEGNTTPLLVDWMRCDLVRRLLQNDRWIAPIYRADSKWHRLVHLFFKDLFIPLCVFHSFAAILNNELNCLYDGTLYEPLTSPGFEDDLKLIKEFAADQVS